MVKNPPANAGDSSSIPGLGRFPGGGNGNPLLYSCLENPMDRGAWWATVRGISKSQTRLKPLCPHLCVTCSLCTTFISFFLITNVGLILSNAFSASMEMMVWFWSLLSFLWYITSVDFHTLNHPCEHGMNLTGSQRLIILLCCWIWLPHIFLRIFASVFIKDTSL